MAVTVDPSSDDDENSLVTPEGGLLIYKAVLDAIALDGMFLTDVARKSISALIRSLVVCPNPMELVADAELIVWVSVFGRTSVLDLMPLFIVVLDAY